TPSTSVPSSSVHVTGVSRRQTPRASAAPARLSRSCFKTFAATSAAAIVSASVMPNTRASTDAAALIASRFASNATRARIACTSELPGVVFAPSVADDVPRHVLDDEILAAYAEGRLQPKLKRAGVPPNN